MHVPPHHWPQTTRMNALLAEMKRSMEELQLGLDGALNMSDKMEALARGIALNTVPALWMSCMSTRVQEVLPLSAWYADVLKRYEQLAAWTAGEVVAPISVWLSGLFNPKVGGEQHGCGSCTARSLSYFVYLAERLSCGVHMPITW